METRNFAGNCLIFSRISSARLASELLAFDHNGNMGVSGKIVTYLSKMAKLGVYTPMAN